MSESYSKAYLHHLFKTEEILGYRIATQHNLKFYVSLMTSIQNHIKDGNFKAWSLKFIDRYNRNDV